MGGIIKFILLVLIVYFFFTVYKIIKGFLRAGLGIGDKTTPFAKAEECPSCHERIRVPKEPDTCPKCHTNLGRSPDGKLLIRVN